MKLISATALLAGVILLAACAAQPTALEIAQSAQADVAEQLDPETLEEIRLNIPDLDQIKIHAPARQRVPIGPRYEPLGNTPVVLSNVEHVLRVRISEIYSADRSADLRNGLTIKVDQDRVMSDTGFRAETQDSSN